MKKILILYFSGVGNTKYVTELCIAKNIVPICYSRYRCSATDDIACSNNNFFTKNEKYINKKIEKDINDFIIEDKMNFNKYKYKWYGLLNYPNKWIAKHFHFRIFLHKSIVPDAIDVSLIALLEQ